MLTAAHCLYGLPGGTITVAMGSVHLNNQKQVPIVGGWYHGNYNPQIFQNDVGLLKLAQPASGNVQTISIGDANAGDKLTLTGWGMTRFPSNNPPEQLQYIDLKAFDTNQCKARWAQLGLPVDQRQICTLSPVGQGACKGDSGGPLVYNGKQVGIVSFGQPCAQGVPDVFTRASAFQDWIAFVMNQMG